MMMDEQDIEARLIEAMRVWRWGEGALGVHQAAVMPGSMRMVDGCEVRRPREQRDFLSSGRETATDGPWALYKPAFSERYDPHADGAARAVYQAVRMPRPDRAMIARAEEAAGWMALVDDAQDRRLVLLAIGALASGRRVVPWGKLLRAMGLERGKWGLSRRYGRALTSIKSGLQPTEMRG